MRWSDIPFHPPKTTLRWFAASGVIVLGALAVWQYSSWDRPSLALLSCGLALVLGTAGLTAPAMLRPVFVGLMVLTYPLNWLMSHIVLGLLFYGIFTPLGVFFKVLGRDPLARKLRRGPGSYWVTKPAPKNIRDYFRQS